MHPEGLIGTLFSKCTYSIGSAGVAQQRRRRRICLGEGTSVSAKGQQIDGSTLSFLTFRTSIGRPMRRLNPVCKESVLKPSNPFVLATRRLPPATPCGPGVLTVRCSSPHAWSRRYYDRQYFKMTMPTLSGGPTAPLSGYCHRTPSISHARHLLHPRQCGPPQLTGGSSSGRGSTFGSQDARGSVPLGALCIT